MGQRPARGAGGGTELFALGAVEHLDDRSVGAVVEIVPLVVDSGHGIEHFIEVLGGEEWLIARDAQRVQQGVEVVFGFQFFAIIGP